MEANFFERMEMDKKRREQIAAQDGKDGDKRLRRQNLRRESMGLGSMVEVQSHMEED